jgi:transcriptional regulator with XRE-family HTH domain
MCLVNTGGATDDASAQAWESAQAARIGKEVRRLRRLRGTERSAAWLAGKAEELGLKMTRQTIADLENGRRRYVTTAELVILATALNTSPVALLYPGPDYNAEIEVLPDIHDRKIEAAQWFSGVRSQGFTPSADRAESTRLRDEYRENIRELRLWRELLDVHAKIASVATMPASARKVLLDTYSDQVRTLRSQLGLENGNGNA